jgi:hypothetical protein
MSVTYFLLFSFLIVFVSYCFRFLLFSFLNVLVPGFARAQAANIFYCAFGVVKVRAALGGCDKSRISMRHSPFQGDGI